jgi:hypothetical protein
MPRNAIRSITDFAVLLSTPTSMLPSSVWGFFASFLLFTSLASAQAPEFTCPANSKRACDSFLELRRAGDAGVFPAADRFGIVCFRPHEDNFFTVTVTHGHLNSDALGKNTDMNGNVFQREWTSAFGRLTAFKSGVADADDTVPVSHFVGTWHTLQEAIPRTDIAKLEVFPNTDAVFVAKSEDDSNTGARVDIDVSSVTISKVFKSTAGADVDYQLSVQLSTGRFVERHSVHDGRTVESLGRCMPFPQSTK